MSDELLWSSPRGSARVTREGGLTLRFESDRDWLDLARLRLRRVASLDEAVLLPLSHETVEDDGASLPALVARHEDASSIPRSAWSPGRAAALVVALAPVVRAVQAQRDPFPLGPFEPALMVAHEGRDRVLFPGLVPLAQSHDQGMRGIRGGSIVRHHRASPDLLRGELALPHEVFCLAVLAIELVCGREPFDTRDTMTYLRALTEGRAAPLETLVPAYQPATRERLDAALAPDPAARPSLDELVAALEAEVQRSGPTRRPWWRFW
jgi:hypothetical protein